MTTAYITAPEKQAIPGVAPASLEETTVMVVWPSMAATAPGRLIGSLCSIRWGVGNILTVGNLLALALIPAAMGLYFWCKLFLGRYRLTNRRVLVESTFGKRELRSASLGDFDTIDLVVLPGQEWFPAGELVFRRGTIESLRLSGVLRPETFRRTCLKSQISWSTVQKALGR